MHRIINYNNQVSVHYDTAWKNLRSSLITRDGMRLLDSDPDISDDTISRLMETEKGFLNSGRKYSFYFNEERDGTDIGQTVISILINENPGVSFAHLVCLYAELKNCPVICALLAMDPFRKSKNGFRRYCYSPIFGLSVKSWHPSARVRPASHALPGKRRGFPRGGIVS